MTIEAPGRTAIRNPASPGLHWESAAGAARASTAALYLEAICLGCILMAVAGVLPLVMLLHR